MHAAVGHNSLLRIFEGRRVAKLASRCSRTIDNFSRGEKLLDAVRGRSKSSSFEGGSDACQSSFFPRKGLRLRNRLGLMFQERSLSRRDSAVTHLSPTERAKPPLNGPFQDLSGCRRLPRCRGKWYLAFKSALEKLLNDFKKKRHAKLS